MQRFKFVLFSALVALAACGSEAGSGQGPLGVVGTPPEKTADMDSSSSAEGGQSVNGDSGTGPDADSDSGGPDAGGGGPTGPDAGGGGPTGPDAGGGGGPVVTSNFHNWSGWNDATACPAWNTTPYAWKEPRTTGIGTKACGAGDVFATGGLYEAYLGPNANATTQAQWDSTHATCKQCAISDWNDPVWGPVVRTPNGHYILNQAGCATLKDPTRKSCALSNWQYRQCGKEACDNSVGQPAYQQCVDAASNTINGACGEAAFGASKGDYTLYSNSSSAWSSCYAVNTGDNLKSTATYVVTAQCY
jgi:hypothetical protein